MKIHFKHLKKFFVNDIDISSLSNVLFQLGHENEFKNEIFDLELTPNRGDCLSLLGIARDLNYFYGHLNNMKIYEAYPQKEFVESMWLYSYTPAFLCVIQLDICLFRIFTIIIEANHVSQESDDH